MSRISRIQKYDLKVDPEHIKDNFVALKPAMVTAETSVFMDQEALEGLTRATLSTETGVHTIQYPSYHAYVKEIGRISHHFRGGSAMMAEVKITVEKWTARGLNAGTLAKLALDIFDIIIVPAP